MLLSEQTPRQLVLTVNKNEPAAKLSKPKGWNEFPDKKATQGKQRRSDAEHITPRFAKGFSKSCFVDQGPVWFLWGLTCGSRTSLQYCRVQSILDKQQSEMFQAQLISPWDGGREQKICRHLFQVSLELGVSWWAQQKTAQHSTPKNINSSLQLQVILVNRLWQDGSPRLKRFHHSHDLVEAKSSCKRDLHHHKPFQAELH